ncbi:Divinyl chlorophyllide a 8-vinyl-reductase-chloroplastic [Striga hermonthica]|uniref:Divinyl chlorophyllide a 8-vinyl-reductase, chloroplastic n=1 Tax=Striga hermonthica TaxID=68872 RepID=A0A9N7MKL4_STRHE|nr:Divinyl chlorophyllide a 8-vinyl-reductase-chloroplastic [Striga hermonthica]
MSICTSFNSNGLALHSSITHSFNRVFTSQLINKTSTPYAIPFPFLHSSEPLKSRVKRFKLVAASAAPENPQISYRSKNPKDINVLVVGSTGYIGKFVVKELVKRGFNVTAIAREKSGVRGKNSSAETVGLLNGANVCFSDVTNLESLENSIRSLGTSIDVVVSCLASRSGGIKDSWLIDYEATRNSLLAGRKFGASHFVLLSAICVQKPLLEFQRAKLKFEAELIREAEKSKGLFSYSIVRPTAFFKSLAGQVELVKDGKPYVMFGDGRLV